MKKTEAVSLYPLPPGPELMEISPDMAADWLENRSFDGNRKTSRAKAEQLAAAMRAGKFLETHQGIAFDTEGKQIDGRHRLTAIALANVTVKMWVFPDQTRDTFDVIDTGYARSAAQFLPSAAPSMAAGATRYISAATDKEYPGVYRFRMSTHDVLEIHRKWPELENWALATYGARSVAKIPPAPLLAIMAMGERGGARPEVIKDFLEGLKSGAIGDARDARLILRNRFIKDGKALSGGRGRTHGYALIVKAFNHHVAGERPKRIIWTDGDHIPLPLGITWDGLRITPPGSEAA